MTARTGAGATPPAGDEFPVGGPRSEGLDAPEVVLHREQLQVVRERVPVERVRVRKRIVTTTRTIEVPVRVEELVVTREPVGEQDRGTPSGDHADGSDGHLVLVLHEEVPEVSLRVVPVERVVVRKRAVRSEETISAELATEVAHVSTDDVSGTCRIETSTP